MTLRAVLDVNILASSLVSSQSSPAAVLRAGLERRYLIVRSGHILSALIGTLEKPYSRVRVNPNDLEDFLVRLVRVSEKAQRDDVIHGVAPDDEDDRVLSAAVAANADFLVTGDKGLLAIGEYMGVRIVTADVFLAELELQ